MHHYSRGEDFAANHVPPTQRVIVTSCMMRQCILLCHILHHGKLLYLQCLFYFKVDVQTAEIK